MPNCFSLSRKGRENEGAVSLVKIDEEFCAHHGVEPDPELYHRNWFDTIGFFLAMGHDWNSMRAKFSSPDWLGQRPEETPEENARRAERLARKLADIDWFEANFTPNAWAEIGKR